MIPQTRQMTNSARNCLGSYIEHPDSSVSDTGYLHDGRADKDSYPHDNRADKNPYWHNRHMQYFYMLVFALRYMFNFVCNLLITFHVLTLKELHILYKDTYLIVIVQRSA